MLENQSVNEIQKNIKSRQISIKEVVEYYLDRIEKFNPDLNAIVLQKDRELIIKEAIEKDKAKEIDKSLKGEDENPIKNPDVLPRRKKI